MIKLKKFGNRLNLIQKVFTHLLFWVAIWFFFYYFFSFNTNVKVYVKWFSSLLLPITMLTTYFMVLYLIPTYLLTKQYFKFGLYTFYTLVASSNLITITLYACLFLLLKFDITLIPPMSKNYLFILILVYLVVGLVSFVELLRHNFRTASRNKELENKILATHLQMKEQELQYLKMQIHPHFLFNTLNTIYGLSLKQSKQTPDVILKLSNLLDYILYRVNKPRVGLKEEVLHISEYIELEKIRFSDSLKVEFLTDAIEDDLQIAPMLFIPFVENAFKHGGLHDGFLSIVVEIKLVGQELSFMVKNSVARNKKTQNKGGIGLTNVRKRLELNYPDRFDLMHGSEGEWYLVRLKIRDLKI